VDDNPSYAAIDTGFYEACSRINADRPSRRWANSLLAAASDLGLRLVCSPAVPQEAASHTASYLAGEDHWRQAKATGFFIDFFTEVQVVPLSPAAALRAEENRRRCVEAHESGKPSATPSSADASTAELMKERDIAMLISDDEGDFRLLLAGYVFRCVAVKPFLGKLDASAE
jgi:hypothetical protein